LSAITGRKLIPGLEFSDQLSGAGGICFAHGSLRGWPLDGAWVIAQGNFNSDNCAAGGFTLTTCPFGFWRTFEPQISALDRGGEHFSFFKQPVAAEANSIRLFWAHHAARMATPKPWRGWIRSRWLR